MSEWLGRFGFPDFQSLSTWLLLESMDTPKYGETLRDT